MTNDFLNVHLKCLHFYLHCVVASRVGATMLSESLFMCAFQTRNNSSGVRLTPVPSIATIVNRRRRRPRPASQRRVTRSHG